MGVEGRLKSMGPQARLSVYHNRTVWAFWIMILTGVLTMAEPFLIFSSKSIFVPGLISPEVLVMLTGQYQGSPAHVVLAVIPGLLIIVLSILGTRGRMAAFKAGAVLFGLDLIFLALGVIISRPDSHEIFMIIITLTVRLYFLGIIIRGIRAAGFKRKLHEVMEAADMEYEDQRRKGVQYSILKDEVDNFESPEYNQEPVIVQKRGEQSNVENASKAQELRRSQCCTNCGSPVGEDDRFCEQCGHDLGV